MIYKRIATHSFGEKALIFVVDHTATRVLVTPLLPVISLVKEAPELCLILLLALAAKRSK